MILNGKTDVGLRRKNNQDSFIIRLWDDIGCALGVVCDGMGGAMGGNIASALACETFVRTVERFMETEPVKRGYATEGDYSTMLAHAVADANGAVYKSTEKDKTLKGMGTTLVAALVTGNVLYAVNVGDSRLYLYNRRRMTQITRDHSLVQYLLDSGKLTAEEAKDYPNRNVITRAVGIERGIEADIFSIDLSELDTDACAMLCSDGLSSYVEGDVICNVLREAVERPEYDGGAAAQTLVDMANHAGGIDNVTVLLIRFLEHVPHTEGVHGAKTLMQNRGGALTDGETSLTDSTGFLKTAKSASAEKQTENKKNIMSEKDTLHGTV